MGGSSFRRWHGNAPARPDRDFPSESRASLGLAALKLPNRKSDQRTTYRVRAAGDESEVFVALRSGPVKAHLDDLSARGCGVVVETDVEGLPDENGDIVLRLLVGGSGMSQLFVKGTVKGIREVENGVRLGIQFSDVERLYAQLKEPQWRFFNRRQAFRVPPADSRGRPLRAHFHLPGAEQPRSIPVHDLSSTGLSVWLAPKNDVPFPKHLPVRVTFRLPSNPGEFDLRVLFVHRTRVEGKQRVGFRIDTERTADADGQAEKILRYVLERQRQLLAAG